MGALDSSFLILPFGNDFLLIALVSSSHGLIWILYVVFATLGSLVGVFMLDLVMRKAGQRGLQRFVKPKQARKLEKKLDKGAGWFVFTTSLLPPPFPFTPAIMSASALQASRTKLYFGVMAGRLVRFTIEALLALCFGRRVMSFLRSPAVDYVVYGFVAIALIGTVFSLWKWVHRRKQK